MSGPIQDGGIRWERVSKESFDRAIETLLTRYHYDHGAEEVWSPDGRGGDGGKDVCVKYPDRTLIYQLKYFPDGFKSSTKSRKTQVRKSFEAAMKNDPPPDEWHLCLPAKVTPGEQTFILGLRQDQPVAVKIFDRPHIEAMLMDYPDLISWMVHDDFVDQKVALYRVETAAMSRGLEDLAERATALHQQAAELDPDWAIDFSISDDGQIFAFRAKHPRSQELSPLGVDPELDDSVRADEIRTNLSEQRAFGLPTSVTVPTEVIRALNWEGPAWLTENLPRLDELGELTLPGQRTRPTIPGLPVDLTLMSDVPALLGSWRGTAVHGGIGTEGLSLTVEINGVLTLTFLLPIEQPIPARINSSFNLDGVHPALARSTARLQALLHEGLTLTVLLDGHELITQAQLNPLDDAEREPFVVMRELAEDLIAIEAATNVEIRFPPSISGHDRVQARILRLLLEGRRTHPVSRTLTASPDRDVDMSGVRKPRAYLATHQGPADVFGQMVPVPPIVVWTDHAEAAGIEAVEKAIADGDEELPSFRVVPAEGHPFTTWMPSRLPAGTEASDLPVSPWGLTGIAGREQ